MTEHVGGRAPGPMPPNTLTFDELRVEVRRCLDQELAISQALRNLPEMPPPWVLLFFSRASQWPEDSNLGKLLQRQLGPDKIPYKSECETGAGVPRPEILPGGALR